MAFWNQLSSTPEPLRQNRWYVEFTGYGTQLESLTYALKSINKPEFEVTFTEHTLLTQTFKLPGLLKWKPITLVMLCAASETQFADKIIMSLFTNYNVPENGKHQTISKYNFTQPLKIHELYPNGVVAQYWEIYNPLITSVKFGDLTYENEDFVNITLTLQYDYAKIVAGEERIKIPSEQSPKKDGEQIGDAATATTTETAAPPA